MKVPTKVSSIKAFIDSDEMMAEARAGLWPLDLFDLNVDEIEFINTFPEDGDWHFAPCDLEVAESLCARSLAIRALEAAPGGHPVSSRPSHKICLTVAGEVLRLWLESKGIKEGTIEDYGYTREKHQWLETCSEWLPVCMLSSKQMERLDVEYGDIVAARECLTDAPIPAVARLLHPAIPSLSKNDEVLFLTATTEGESYPIDAELVGNWNALDRRTASDRYPVERVIAPRFTCEDVEKSMRTGRPALDGRVYVGVR